MNDSIFFFCLGIIYVSISGIGMTRGRYPRPRRHLRKSRKRRLRRAMKSPPKSKAAWADVTRAKF